MNRTVWQLLLAMALVSGLFILGCSDDNNDNPLPPPDYMQLLDGNWDARDVYVDSLGIDQQRYTFSNPNNSYHLIQTAGQTTFDYYGTYSVNATAVTFTEYVQDTDSLNPPLVFTRNYSISGGDSVLTLEYDDGSNHMNVIYDKL